MRESAEAIKNDQALAKLTAIQEHLAKMQPIRTAEDLKLLSPYEHDLAFLAKVESCSLQECCEVEAEAKGYDSVADMFEAENKITSSHIRDVSRGDAGLSADFATGEITLSSGGKRIVGIPKRAAKGFLEWLHST